jgi:hypothetical protein
MLLEWPFTVLAYTGSCQLLALGRALEIPVLGPQHERSVDPIVVVRFFGVGNVGFGLLKRVVYARLHVEAQE